MYVNEAATVIQSHFRGYLVRKRNKEVDLLFGALVAEVEPDKLLNFWDCEAISRRNNPKTTKRPSSQASQTGEATDCPKPDRPEKENKIATVLQIEETPEKILEEAGIDTRILGISELKSKRSQLLSDLWWLQSAIISRRDITRADKNFSEA